MYLFHISVVRCLFIQDISARHVDIQLPVTSILHGIAFRSIAFPVVYIAFSVPSNANILSTLGTQAVGHERRDFGKDVKAKQNRYIHSIKAS